MKEFLSRGKEKKKKKEKIEKKRKEKKRKEKQLLLLFIKPPLLKVIIIQIRKNRTAMRKENKDLGGIPATLNTQIPTMKKLEGRKNDDACVGIHMYKSSNASTKNS